MQGILNTDVVVVRGGRGNGKSQTIKTIIEARVTEIRAEAIKEFTARLNEIPTNAVEKYKINSIVKEMVDK